MPTTKGDNNWHFDKRVPIALMMTIFVQTAGAVWWAASISERVAVVERRVDASAPQAERIIRVEVLLQGLKDDLVEIKAYWRAQRVPAK